MIFCPKLDPKDLETERSVIFEEMGMYEDDPEDLAIEKLSDKVFRTSSLGRQILGDKAALRKITSADLKKYMNEKYTGENIVVAISGKINEDDIKYLADKMKKEVGFKEVLIGYVGSVIGSHSGPGTLALFYLGTER
jgi:predicted Zn-dependent peptidase